MYLVGIDISKFKHDCFIMTETGEVINNSFSFDNNDSGFTLLLNTLKSLDQSQKIKIGLEATGHYGNNLKLFLTENSYSFMELNPYLVKKFAESFTLRRTKTDKLDAMTIASVLGSPNLTYEPYQISSYHISSLKSLTRYREAFIKERSLHLVQLTNIMDQIFPEFKPFFNGKFGTTAIYILKKYKTPERISKLTDEDILKIKTVSRKISAAKLVKLRELAKNTVGHSSISNQILLKSILNLYTNVDDEVSEIEKQIDSIMSEYKNHIVSIPGISKYSAAQIIGEVGDFKRFSSASKLLAFAGMEPSTIQSGTMDFKGKMVKHGSGHLRYVLMNIAMTIIVHNPTFYSYYSKKHHQEGKNHRVALSHVVRKLVRIIYHLEVTNQDFKSNLLK